MYGSRSGEVVHDRSEHRGSERSRPEPVANTDPFSYEGPQGRRENEHAGKVQADPPKGPIGAHRCWAVPDAGRQRDDDHERDDPDEQPSEPCLSQIRTVAPGGRAQHEQGGEVRRRQQDGSGVGDLRDPQSEQGSVDAAISRHDECERCGGDDRHVQIREPSENEDPREEGHTDKGSGSCGRNNPTAEPVEHAEPHTYPSDGDHTRRSWKWPRTHGWARRPE